jgi:hypothetical protein
VVWLTHLLPSPPTTTSAFYLTILFLDFFFPKNFLADKFTFNFVSLSDGIIHEKD